MKHFKSLAIVPALAVALTGLLTTGVASAEWYKHFDNPAYTTKDGDSSQVQFANSGTVTTDAQNMDQDKRVRHRQTEYEIKNNLR